MQLVAEQQQYLLVYWVVFSQQNRHLFIYFVVCIVVCIVCIVVVVVIFFCFFIFFKQFLLLHCIYMVNEPFANSGEKRSQILATCPQTTDNLSSPDEGSVFTAKYGKKNVVDNSPPTVVWPQKIGDLSNRHSSLQQPFLACFPVLSQDSSPENATWLMEIAEIESFAETTSVQGYN